MAKIEVAYSLEIEEYVGAIEANELWIDGKLKDKKAFICAGKDCYAGITCKNMDTYASDRKMMSQQDNMHSDSCEIYRDFLEKDVNRNNTKKHECKGKTGKGICFHMTRPERHRIIEHTLPTEQEINLKEREKQIRKKRIKAIKLHYIYKELCAILY